MSACKVFILGTSHLSVANNKWEKYLEINLVLNSYSKTGKQGKKKCHGAYGYCVSKRGAWEFRVSISLDWEAVWVTAQIDFLSSIKLKLLGIEGFN